LAKLSLAGERRPALGGLLVALACALGLPGSALIGAGESQLPGVAAPPATVREIQSALQLAIRRFEARDVAGVLAHVSEQYRTGPFTKAGVREQLHAMYGVYDEVRARVRVDQVRMVGEHAWVYSSGDVSGRLPLFGYWVSILSWERELEVARRESGGWRLFGYQQ
jgi:hypothetical protein